jgi:hypothetical protein
MANGTLENQTLREARKVLAHEVCTLLLLENLPSSCADSKRDDGWHPSSENGQIILDGWFLLKSHATSTEQAQTK